MIKKQFTRSFLVWEMLGIPVFAIGQVPRGPFIISLQINADKSVDNND